MTADNAKVAAEKVADAAASLKSASRAPSTRRPRRWGPGKATPARPPTWTHGDEVFVEEEVVTEAEPKPLP